MLPTLVTHLKEDMSLAAMLAEGLAGPAVFLDWAPDHDRPYMTLSYTESLDTEHVSEGEIDVDLWGDGTSAIELEPLRDAVIERLDHVILSTSRGLTRFFWLGDQPVQEDDPGTVRWRVRIGFRRGRTEHVD